MRRFFVPPEFSRGGVFELPEREARHATQVLRLTLGAEPEAVAWGQEMNSRSRGPAEQLLWQWCSGDSGSRRASALQLGGCHGYMPVSVKL